MQEEKEININVVSTRNTSAQQGSAIKGEHFTSKSKFLNVKPKENTKSIHQFVLSVHS